MALIVVMEDDAGTRTLIASVLRKDGHEVLTAENGAQGLVLVRGRAPQLIISDVQMPEMNGFDMLADLRHDAAIAAIPVILLTSLQERAHMRIGMTTGADDYITKPFRPAELREAVAAQIGKRALQASLQGLAVSDAVDRAVRDALEEQRHQLAKLYERRLAKELSDRWPVGDGAAGDESFAQATVLFVDIPNYGAVSQRLDATEVAALVRRFYGQANDTAQLFGARHIQFVGEGLLALFTPQTDTETVTHGLRAVRAALGLADAGRGIDAYLRATYPGRDLPPFGVNVALHAGPVVLTRLDDALHGGETRVMPVGDAVGLTMQLQRDARTLDWAVLATAPVLRSVTGAIRAGRRALLEPPGRAAVDAGEVLGFAAAAA